MTIRIIHSYYSKSLRIHTYLYIFFIILGFIFPIILDLQSILNRGLFLLSIAIMLFILIVIGYDKTYIEKGKMTFFSNKILIKTNEDELTILYCEIDKILIRYSGYKGEQDVGIRSPFRTKRGTKNFITIETMNKKFTFELLFENKVMIRKIKEYIRVNPMVQSIIVRYESEKNIELVH
jgi:hypothetical protein